MPALSETGLSLARALRAAVGTRAGLVVEAGESRPWASVTFSGERHRLRLRLAGEDAEAAAEALIDGLDEREFDLPGHIVADLAVTARQSERGGVRIALEALTVEAD